MLANYTDNGERGLVSEFIWGIVGTEQVCNDQEHSKTVIILLIIIALEIFDSVKYLLNGNTTHTERGVKKKKKNRRLCSSRFEIYAKIIYAACRIYC